MGDEIQTHEEENLQSLQLMIKQQENVEQNMDEQIQQIDMQDIQSQENKDNVAEYLQMLIIQNKINKNNAFQVPFPNIQDLKIFKDNQNLNDEQMVWNKLAQTLDVGSKIYGYRVDNVFTETFKMIGGLSRGKDDKIKDDDEDEEEQSRQQLQSQQEEQLQQINQNNESRSNIHNKHLDKQNLIQLTSNNILKFEEQSKIDLLFDTSPLFQKISEKFDESGASGLLLNNISTDNHLKLIFESDELPLLQTWNNYIQYDYLFDEEQIKSLEYPDMNLEQDFCLDLNIFREQNEEYQEQLLGIGFYQYKQMESYQQNEQFYEEYSQEYDEPLQTQIQNNLFNDSFQNEYNLIDSTLQNNKSAIDINLIQSQKNIIGKGFIKLQSNNWMEPTLWKKMKTQNNFLSKKNQGNGKKKKNDDIDDEFLSFHMNEVENIQDLQLNYRQKQRNNLQNQNLDIEQQYVILQFDYNIDELRFKTNFLRLAQIEQNQELNSQNTLNDSIQQQNYDDIMYDDAQHHSNFEQFSQYSVRQLGSSQNQYKVISMRFLKESLWEQIHDNKQLINDQKNEKISENNSMSTGFEDSNLTFQKILNNNKFNLIQNGITVQTCFLTILHLANEQQLFLEDENQTKLDFKISRK